MNTELFIANMLRIASEDLDGALLLASRDNRNAVYLCEQAAEKVIRAVLTSEGKHAGIKHLLNEMVDQIPDENPLKPALRDIEDLGAFATSYRYPTPGGRIPSTPSGSQLMIITQKIKAALDEVARRLDVDLPKSGTPAGRLGPIR